MKVGITFKAIDRYTHQPIPGVNTTLETPQTGLTLYTGPDGIATFTVDVGGEEVGRHPEEGIPITITANKRGYYQWRRRFMCYENRGIIAQMERT